MDIDEISGNIEKNPGKFLSTLSILHNNERQFGFDTTIVSEIGQGVSKVFQTGLEEGIRHTNHQVIHMYLLLSDLMTSQYQKYHSR